MAATYNLFCFSNFNFFSRITGLGAHVFNARDLKFPILTPPEEQQKQMINEYEEHLLKYNICNALSLV